MNIKIISDRLIKFLHFIYKCYIFKSELKNLLLIIFSIKSLHFTTFLNENHIKRLKNMVKNNLTHILTKMTDRNIFLICILCVRNNSKRSSSGLACYHFDVHFKVISIINECSPKDEFILFKYIIT